jgi:hypothetical protein
MCFMYILSSEMIYNIYTSNNTHMFFKFHFFCFYKREILKFQNEAYELILFSINTTVKVDWVEDCLS